MQQKVVQIVVRGMKADQQKAEKPLFCGPIYVRWDLVLAEWKAVTTIFIGTDSPVISTTCVFRVPQDVQQNVVQEKVTAHDS